MNKKCGINYYSCKDKKKLTKINSLSVNKAMLPAIAVCHSQNAKLIQDAKCADHEVINYELSGEDGVYTTTSIGNLHLKGNFNTKIHRILNSNGNLQLIGSPTPIFLYDREYYQTEFATDINLIFEGIGTPPFPTAAQMSDPYVVKINNQWHMFSVSLSLVDGKIHTYQSTLPQNDPLAVSGWTWNSTPIISPSSNDLHWDFSSTETPSYVRGYDNTNQQWVERIYYTGWRNKSLNPGNKDNYAIGFAQKNGSLWEKHINNPVLNFTETSIYGTLGGDQQVLYIEEENKWYIFYQEGTELGHTILKVAESVDGISWINKRQVNFSPPNAPLNLPNGPYHISISKINNKWYFVGWLSKTSLDKQGIWCSISNNLEKETIQDFHYWTPLLFEKTSGSSWYAINDNAKQSVHELGLFGSHLVKDGNNLFLFFHVVVFNEFYSNNIASIGACNISSNLLNI